MMRYIVVWPTAAIMTMMLVMLIAIHLLSDEAVDYEIKQDLRQKTDAAYFKVSIENGELVIAEDFEYESENVCFVIVKRDGKVVEGRYPEGVESELGNYRVRNNRSFVVNSDEKYYVRDLRIGKYRDKGLFIRGILKVSDAQSFYRRIEIISYFSMAAFFAVILLYEIFFAKKISRELKDMCKTAESIGTSLDMSQRMKSVSHFYETEILRQANNRMLDRVEQTFQIQEQFTSDVAHELRTPVATLLAQCQYAIEKVHDNEEFDEVLEVVYRQSEKINTIIMQLLKFSRLDQDRIEIRNEEVDLALICQTICEEWQDKARDKVSIQMHLKEAVTMGDIGLISIIIQNLISNAVKFSHPKGIIEVFTGEDEQQVFVTVRDYGVGITPENTELVFRRFYQCDESRSAEGFGLGLPLSKKIAEKCGGRITLESEPDKGSTFTLYLPRK